jgi:hypothetical protein
MIPTAVPRFTGLCDNERVFGVCRLVVVVFLMHTRDHECLPVAREERIEAASRLAKKALPTYDRAELLRALVAHDPLGQPSQPHPVAASQEDGPQIPRKDRGRFRFAAIPFQTELHLRGFSNCEQFH